MNNVIYRDLEEKDYNRIKELINEAFGFSDFIKDDKVLEPLLNIYMQNCIMDSSFSQVAVKDNLVVGIILGDFKNDKKKLKNFKNTLSLIYNYFKLIFSSKESKKALKEFSKISNAYKELLDGREAIFQGCIQLFIVCKEYRGLGLGKSLVNNLFKYMMNLNTSKIYLFTDSRCNFKFYDSQNFKRLDSKEVYINKLKNNLNIFLYEYQLK